MSGMDIAIICLFVLWAALGVAGISMAIRRRRLKRRERAEGLTITVRLAEDMLNEHRELACSQVVSEVLQQMMPAEHDAHMRILCHLFGKARAQVAKAEIEMLEKARSVTPAPPKVH